MGLEGLVGTTARLNNALRRLGSGWAIFVEAQRHPAGAYPPGAFPDGVSNLVDHERRAQFDEAGAHFESSYFLTLVWLPPAEDAARAEAWLYEGRDQSGVDGREQLAAFIDRTDRVLNLSEGFMPEAAWLSDVETLTYLHATIATRRHRVRVPETPMHLDAFLADQPLIGGLEPRLGEAHLRTLTVMGFPSQTWPGLLDDLNRLAFDYRGVTRAICLDKTDAAKVLGRIRRQWFAKRKSIAAMLKEIMTNEASALMDTDAANKAADADLALQELGSDLVGTAYVTATVTVWDKDPRIAEERLRLVEKVIQGRDFTCMAERVNAVEAWLGSLPGHVYANVRQPPISTGRAFRCAATLSRQDGRVDAVSLLAPCRRRRPHPGGWTYRRGQVGAAGADGTPVSPLCRLPGLCLRFRRIDPGGCARHGRRLA